MCVVRWPRRLRRDVSLVFEARKREASNCDEGRRAHKRGETQPAGDDERERLKWTRGREGGRGDNQEVLSQMANIFFPPQGYSQVLMMSL